jgi:hypothetical protein
MDVEGKKIEMTLPLRPGLVQLRTRKTPRCFCTVSLTTDNPTPVPDLPLVVKNGSNTLGR